MALKYLPQYFSTTLNVGGGINDSQTTGIVITSVSGLDITKPGQVCFSYSDPVDTSVAEWIDYTSINGSNELQGVVRGREGFSAKSHLNQATAVFVLSASHINDLNDKLTGNNANAIEDPNGNEILKTSYAASAVNEVTIANTATGTGPSVSATGGDANIDLNLNSKGTGAVMVNGTTISAGTAGVYAQACVDGGCEVAQKTTTVNISTSYQYGQVDMYRAKATGTAVSAGTITQTSSANVGTTGYALKLAGVTLTGSGVVYANHLIDPPSARKYKNQTASFSVKVYHDVGSAVDYTVVIGKASTLNNFGTITTIATSSATSVANTTATTVTFKNISMGDCSNGISIEVSAACGAVTTKNFEFTEWQFNLGSVVLPYVPADFGEELGKIQRRFYKKSHNYATSPGTQEAASLIYHVLSDNVTNKLVRVTVGLPGVMAKTPTLSYWDNAATPNASKITTYNTAFVGTDNVSATSTAVTDNSFYVYYTGAVAGIGFSYTVDARPS